MAEHSYFWGTNFVGDGIPIPEEAWDRIFATMCAPVSLFSQVWGMAIPDQRAGYKLELTQVGGATSLNFNLGPGAAIIGGAFYQNDANISFVFNAPQWTDEDYHDAAIRIKSAWAERMTRVGNESGDPWYPGEVVHPPNSIGGGTLGGEVNFGLATLQYRYSQDDAQPIITNFKTLLDPNSVWMPSQVFSLLMSSINVRNRQGGDATIFSTPGSTNYPSEEPWKLTSVVLSAPISGTSGSITLIGNVSQYFIPIGTVLGSNNLAFLNWRFNLSSNTLDWANAAGDQPSFMVLYLSKG